MVEQVLPILQLVLAFGNICILGYALFKFLNKPHDTLETKVNVMDEELKEIKQSLRLGNDRFREHEEKFKEQEETNATFKSVMLAFVDFEIAYCLHTNYEFTEDLKKAKKELQDYLAR